MQRKANDAQTTMPVYLFTGFLESGKTRFIQETLSDKRFNRGEKTLLLVCEEGVEEYDPAAFSGKNVDIRVLEDESELTTENLSRLESELGFERVMIEYNGMWLLDTLYQTMPEGWAVFQEFMFAEYGTFASYNANMRQLVYDKLKSCDIVVFNRTPQGADMQEFHKIVRAANRGCSIAYEHPDGSVEYDETEDPLPYDMNAPVVVIDDKDYAIWYRDMGEELDEYNGKTVRFKCMFVDDDGLPAGSVIVGRPMMNCCAQDISLAGLVAEKVKPGTWKPGDWAVITASITVKRHKAYGRKGPVLTVSQVQPAEKPEDEVATFY